MSEDTAVCRGCGRKLDGKPYYMGGDARIPETGRRAGVCHYGGFVCSYGCDWRACLRLEQTMPGHGLNQTKLDGNLDRELRQKWGIE